jgi:hypothetical protein
MNGIFRKYLEIERKNRQADSYRSAFTDKVGRLLKEEGTGLVHGLLNPRRQSRGFPSSSNLEDIDVYLRVKLTRCKGRNDEDEYMRAIRRIGLKNTLQSCFRGLCSNS